MVLADDRFIVIELVDVEIAKLLGEHVVKLLWVSDDVTSGENRRIKQPVGGKQRDSRRKSPTRTYEYGRFLSRGKPGMSIPPLFFAARGRRARTAAGGIRGRRARTAAGGITAEAPCTLDA